MDLGVWEDGDELYLRCRIVRTSWLNVLLASIPIIKFLFKQLDKWFIS